MKNNNTSEELNWVFKELAQKAQKDAQRLRQSTGFPSLDKLTSGLVDGAFVVIGSRPAMGKTMLALDIADHLAKSKDKATVLFSLELSEEQILNRLLVKGGLTNYESLRSGKTSKNNVQQLTKSYLENNNIYIDDNPYLTVEEMEIICKNIENLGAVIIDYFQLINDPAYHTDNKNRLALAYSSKARSLKVMAQNLGVPVICTSQLPRSIDLRKEKRPMLSDLNCCGVLQQDADQIILLYRDSYYNSDLKSGIPDEDILECIVVKNRYGDLGMARIKWNLDRCAFYDDME